MIHNIKNSIVYQIRHKTYICPAQYYTSFQANCIDHNWWPV